MLTDATGGAARNDPTISAVHLVADGWLSNAILRGAKVAALARWTSRMNFGGPYRTARLAIITTLVGVLAAAPVSAFDIRPDKNLAGVTATNPDEATKELEAELAPLASDMNAKTARRKRLQGG